MIDDFINGLLFAGLMVVIISLIRVIIFTRL